MVGATPAAATPNCITTGSWTHDRQVGDASARGEGVTPAVAHAFTRLSRDWVWCGWRMMFVWWVDSGSHAGVAPAVSNH